MPKPTEAATNYAAMLTLKFAAGYKSMAGTYEFSVIAGNKYDKIVQQYRSSTGQLSGESVHAFIARQTGWLYKAAGWTAPAKDVRFTDLTKAIEKADPHGSYLYK